jgi:hypothetical protein
MATSVFCIVPDLARAEHVVSRLRNAGFADQDISVLMPDTRGTRDFAHEKHTKAPEGAATGAAAGGVLGGALGLLAGIGALAIPGLGPFIAAGPIMGALSGLGVGAAVGGITGCLVGMGIPELEAKRYEDKVKNGNILISAHSESSGETSRAKKIFEDAGATDIGSTSESKAPNPSTPARSSTWSSTPPNPPSQSPRSDASRENRETYPKTPSTADPDQIPPQY